MRVVATAFDCHDGVPDNSGPSDEAFQCNGEDVVFHLDEAVNVGFQPTGFDLYVQRRSDGKVARLFHCESWFNGELDRTIAGRLEWRVYNIRTNILTCGKRPFVA